MGEFSHGWRRKLGVVTLVIACVFMAGWVRSVKIYEEASFLINNRAQLFIESGDGVFSFGRSLANDPDFFAGRPNWSRYRAPQHIREGWEHFRWYWRFSDVGVGIHSGFTQHIDELLLVVMPYWLIAIPLTLISAFLLLSKPRKSTTNKLTEPIPVEGK